MPKRRMFSLQIVDTDAFLEMPMTSQLLYFHLAMRADDEGFVGNPKRIIKMMGSSEDDFKVLIAKRFLLSFESGVVVIKHWLIHNTIRMDRFSSTSYKLEKSKLGLRENKAYTEIEKVGCLSGNQMATQEKISKVKLREDKRTSSSKGKPFYKETGEEMRYAQNMWWVIPNNGGKWSEFCGSVEKDIIWK